MIILLVLNSTGFVAAKASETEVYRLPPFLGQRDLPAPKKSLPASRNIRIFSNYGNSRAAPIVIEYSQNPKTGKYHRLSMSRVDFGNDSARVATRTCQSAISTQNRARIWTDEALTSDFIQWLQDVRATRLIENQALHEYQSVNYFGDEANPSFYSHLSEDSQPSHEVYLESINYINASDLALYFGETPWARIGEIFGPPDLSASQVRDGVEDGDPNFTVVLRRATLRLALGQHISYANKDDEKWQVAPLPFERSAQASSDNNIHADRENFDFVFELGRATQIPGMNGEALFLSKFAMTVAAQQMAVLSETGELPIPLSRAKLYVATHHRAHSRLYNRILGVSEDPELNRPNSHEILMSAPLDKVLQTVKPDTDIEVFDDYRNLRGINRDLTAAEMSESIKIHVRLASPWVDYDVSDVTNYELINRNSPLAVLFPHSLAAKRAREHLEKEIPSAGESISQWHIKTNDNTYIPRLNREPPPLSAAQLMTVSKPAPIYVRAIDTVYFRSAKSALGLVNTLIQNVGVENVSQYGLLIEVPDYVLSLPYRIEIESTGIHFIIRSKRTFLYLLPKSVPSFIERARHFPLYYIDKGYWHTERLYFQMLGF